MYDTVAAIVVPPEPLPDALFGGGMVMEQFDKDDVAARLWLNPQQGEYAPRITYWRSQGKRVSGTLGGHARVSDHEDRGVLKIEFSIAKMAGVSLANVDESDKAAALQLVDVYLRQHMGSLPSVSEWRAQRIDYAWNWPIGALLSAYMVVLHNLNLSTYSRHPFEATSGVVWKSKGTRGRWVKFYNKTEEIARTINRGRERAARLDMDYTPDQQVLRFEISNYREAVRYMASDWFCCDQTVREMLHPGRALYCMAYHWDKLGLGAADSYGYDEMLMVRLLECYGQRGFARAHSTLMLIARYGNSVYAEGVALMSKATYHRWKRELLRDGFLTAVNEDDVSLNKVALPALHLPVQHVINTLNLADAVESWKSDAAATKTPHKIFWKSLAEGISASGGQPSEYLMQQVGEYVH